MIEYPGKYWTDYELIDSGAGEKLERFGGYVLARPEPKALWDKSLPNSEWKRRAHTVFVPGAGFGRAGKEDSGSWNRLRKMDDQWYMDYRSPQGLDMKLRLGMTSFKHVGVFPEQGRRCRRHPSRLSETGGHLGSREHGELGSGRHTLGGRGRDEVRQARSPQGQSLRRHNSRPSRLRARSRRRKMETRRMSVRDAEDRGGDTQARTFVRGAQPVFQRILGPAGRNSRARSLQGRTP